MRTILALLLLTLAGCAEARTHYSVALDLGKGKCSATVVGPDILLSAAHCFDAGRLTAIDGVPAYALEMVRDGRDHVLVRVNVRFTSWAVMGPQPKVGDRLTLHGNIWGIGLMYREGVVAGEATPEPCPFKFAACDLILVDMTTDGGDSGAGYYDSRGRVVGVHTGVLSMRNSLAVILPLAFTDENWRDIRA
jgi:hypothetical protein